jgi:type II secretory pathway pseudopilin PulG
LPGGPASGMMTSMDPQRMKKIIIALVAVIVFLSLPVALAVVGGWGLWQERQARREQEAEFSEALRQSLERAADVVLPSPTLGADAVTVETPSGDLAAESRRIIRLAKGVGGSASSWNDGTSVRVIANVPAGAETLFRESVGRGVYDLASAGEGGPMTVVEVLVKPAD